MPGSDVKTNGLAILPGIIPGSVIKCAEEKINQDEVQKLLRRDVGNWKDREPITLDRETIDKIYQSFMQLDRTTLAELLDTDVKILDTLPKRVMPFLNVDCEISQKYWAFDPEDCVVVVIPISQPNGAKDHEYMKGSHIKGEVSDIEDASVSLQPGQVMPSHDFQPHNHDRPDSSHEATPNNNRCPPSCIVDMAKNPIPQCEIRIAIRFDTTNVPGEPRNRLRRIANDFAESKLSRMFDSDSDFFHWAPDFHLTTSKRVWMLCDFNICGKVLQVDAVPIQWWNVTYDDQQSPRFTERRMNGKSFTNRYPWGGRDIEWEYRLQQRNIERPREALITGE
ncbi:MAG: hypothetical protein M1840_005273 [Geoglossum simile]|nr:MAG: hypothetical protein M1840_005273 [Geoglossum simile]